LCYRLRKFGLWEQRVFSVARLPRPSHMPPERLWESMLYDNNLKASEQLLDVMTPVANAIKTSHSWLVFAVDHAGSAP
jgi:hypothetical protein